jgi:hypothetical protein
MIVPETVHKTVETCNTPENKYHNPAAKYTVTDVGSLVPTYAQFHMQVVTFTVAVQVCVLGAAAYSGDDATSRTSVLREPPGDGDVRLPDTNNRGERFDFCGLGVPRASCSPRAAWRKSTEELATVFATAQWPSDHVDREEVNAVATALGGEERACPAATYGEVPTMSLLEVLASPQVAIVKEDAFLDLGSGIGKLVIAASLFLGPVRATGVEFSTERWASACEALDRYSKTHAAAAAEVDFVRGDMMTMDLRPYTLLYAYSPCFPPRMMERLVFQMRQMRAGSRIVLVSYEGLPEELHHVRFPGLGPDHAGGGSGTAADDNVLVLRAELNLDLQERGKVKTHPVKVYHVVARREALKEATARGELSAEELATLGAPGPPDTSHMHAYRWKDRDLIDPVRVAAAERRDKYETRAQEFRRCSGRGGEAVVGDDDKPPAWGADPLMAVAADPSTAVAPIVSQRAAVLLREAQATLRGVQERRRERRGERTTSS